MGISENIKILRSIYKLSQKELAIIAGVSDKAVSTWENGIKDPRMGTIQKIADHFGLQKSNIIEDNGLEKKNNSNINSSNEKNPPQDLKKILEGKNIKYNGRVMSEEEKKFVEKMLANMYYQAKELNDKKE